MENSKFDFTRDHHKWAERAQGKYGQSKNDWLDLIAKQEGRCAISGVMLRFDADSGTAREGGPGVHPIYASVDRRSPGSDKHGYQIVCYDLNDLKAALPHDCFEELRDCASWKKLMERWRKQAEIDSDNRDAFKKIRRED
ncbi:hypothetical protein M1N83_01180 [Dehalococcoidia bacterium]|nr:hypothetical protein [Dehalococcoidia bacterium]